MAERDCGSTHWSGDACSTYMTIYLSGYHRVVYILNEEGSSRGVLRYRDDP